MSKENVEFLREDFQAVASGDPESWRALSRSRISPNFEFHSVLLGRVFSGPHWAGEFREDIAQAFDDFALEVEEIVDLGERVVVVVRVFGRGKGAARQRLVSEASCGRSTVRRPSQRPYTHPRPRPWKRWACRSRDPTDG